MANHFSAEIVVKAFLSFIKNDENSKSEWDKYNLEPWTQYSSKTLFKILKENFDLTPACKGFCDDYGRSEYFNIDVIAYDDNAWKPPKIVIEIENLFRKIQYCTWKLVSINCEARILLTYYYSDSNSQHVANSFNQVVKELEPIKKDNEKASLLLLCADASKYSSNTPWDDIFQYQYL